MNHIVTNVRGLIVDPHFATLVRMWSNLVRLSTETTEFSRAAIQLYYTIFYAPLAVVGTDITADNMRSTYLAQFESPLFLADNAREMIYLRQQDSVPVHNGLRYEMVNVVFSRETGDAKKKKIAQAIGRARDNMVRLKDTRNFRVHHARIIVVLFADPSRRIVRVPAIKLNTHMSVETWDSRELLYDIALNKLVPRQIPLEMLTPQERTEIGVKYLNMATRESTKLPRMFTDDAVAMYAGFIKGQIICSFRNNRNEGGKSYGFRLVWPRGTEAHKLGVIATQGAGTDADYEEHQDEADIGPLGQEDGETAPIENTGADAQPQNE